jgi:hypothetical protein
MNMAKGKVSAIYSAACKFGRAGFGAHSGSIGCKIPEKAMPEECRHLFIGTTLEVLLSLNPEPQRSGTLPTMQDAFESVQLQVHAKRISVSDSEVGFSLNFDKSQMAGDTAKTFAGQGGSIVVLRQLESQTPPEDESLGDDSDDTDDEE